VRPLLLDPLSPKIHTRSPKKMGNICPHPFCEEAPQMGPTQKKGPPFPRFSTPVKLKKFIPNYPNFPINLPFTGPNLQLSHHPLASFAISQDYNIIQLYATLCPCPWNCSLQALLHMEIQSL